jgi:hypothetical protein
MIDLDAVRSVTNTLQLLALMSAIGMVLLTLYIGWRWPRYRSYLSFPLTLGVHATVFYVLATSDAILPAWGNLWSSLLRLHSYTMILLVLAAAILWLRSRDRTA